ncbi:nucleotidyltransferase domain-containing protein [Psychrobacillus lasiicapitis]|uniref:nucleotidyltransferase domain-containing protein n=1 Tax=Psychrobacillus lasiicapitis TaxID=1636719 RepID=UPI001477764D|nr:nucleotidyltransferase domain-containing protein [Psychrobacillus lasiicapitis]
MSNQMPMYVQSFTQNYVELLNKHLPSDLIEGVYIYGSIALGAFDEVKSDIDFIVLLSSAVNEQELSILQDIHVQMNKHAFGKRMDGLYIQASMIGKTNEELPAYPYCTDGIVEVGYWDVNHITWWILKKHGITLQGIPIGELNIPTKWDDVLETMEYNINQYWFSKSKKTYLFLSDSMVEFATCTISRIVCSLELRAILSKDEAVRLCVDMLPKRWHLLLKEGFRIRKKANTKSLYKSKLKRARDCRDFILYTHQLCNENFFIRGVSNGN